MESVARGARLGPYETIELIGSGGMGEVWKARDCRLGRIVAIKISKQQFSERFEREARAISAGLEWGRRRGRFRLLQKFALAKWNTESRRG
jgi:serine/threonine protein kinase